MPSCPERVIDVQDRVANELAGAVICDVAAALGSNQFGTDSSGLALQIGREVSCPPVGKDVRVLEEQQVLLGAVFEQRRLDRERFTVGHAAQSPDSQRSSFSWGLTPTETVVSHNSVDQSLVSRISLTRFRNPAA